MIRQLIKEIYLNNDTAQKPNTSDLNTNNPNTRLQRRDIERVFRKKKDNCRRQNYPRMNYLVAGAQPSIQANNQYP